MSPKGQLSEAAVCHRAVIMQTEWVAWWYVFVYLCCLPHCLYIMMMMCHACESEELSLCAYSGRYPFSNSGDIRSVCWWSSVSLAKLIFFSQALSWKRKFHCFMHDSVKAGLCNQLTLEHVVPVRDWLPYRGLSRLQMKAWSQIAPWLKNASKRCEFLRFYYYLYHVCRVWYIFWFATLR